MFQHLLPYSLSHLKSDLHFFVKKLLVSSYSCKDRLILFFNTLFGATNVVNENGRFYDLTEESWQQWKYYKFLVVIKLDLIWEDLIGCPCIFVLVTESGIKKLSICTYCYYCFTLRISCKYFTSISILEKMNGGNYYKHLLKDPSSIITIRLDFWKLALSF